MNEINSGRGTIGRLLKDSTIAENINQTIVNLKASSKGLDENMNAAKENFLLRGYFKRKDRVAAQKRIDAQEKIEEQKKLKEENK
jgi:phospholipid/cholesterol/gamma-HCH transport system substrate-binding protein